MSGGVSVRIASLFLAAFLCWFYPCSAGAQKPKAKPVGWVSVVDSKGKTVASVLGGLGLSFAPVVMLEAKGRLIAVLAYGEGFLGSTYLYYESTDCSGVPWLQGISPDQPESRFHSLLQPAGIGRPGHTAYVAAADSTSHLLTIRSFFIENMCSPLSTSKWVIPTEALIDLDTEFTPPFQLRSVP